MELLIALLIGFSLMANAFAWLWWTERKDRKWWMKAYWELHLLHYKPKGEG